ncbi:ATP-binding protein [Rhodocista pekingensis]|uniref:histidine kinase n=1 Tax=Rhodocista pekingensis TaxID=201185 RepID=A0ABW2KSR4_9PROT
MRAALFGALIMLATLQFIGTGSDIQAELRDWRAARSVIELKRISTDLLLGIRDFALERSVGLSALTSPDPVSAEVQRTLADHRSIVNLHIEQALSQLRQRTDGAVPALADELAAAFGRVEAVRRRLDAAITLPAAEREPGLRDIWLESVNAQAESMHRILIALNQPALARGGQAVPLELLIAEGLRLREEAGRDILTLIRAEALPPILTPDRRAALDQAGQRLTLRFERTRELVEQTGDPLLADAFDRAQNLFLTSYFAERARLLAQVPGEPGTLPAAATAGLNAVTDLLSAAMDRADKAALARQTESVRLLGMSALEMLAAFVATLIAVGVVHFRVLAPIVRLTRSMRQLADGDLEAEVPVPDRHDEIGEMARAVSVFKRNAHQLAVDNRERERAERMLTVEREILELTASRAPQERILQSVCEGVERQVEGSACSIMLLEPDGIHLRIGAAPHLPTGFLAAVDGVAVGPGVGSCGPAIYDRRPIVTTDMEADPNWQSFRPALAGSGLRACWSLPILTADGKPLGAFAVYHTSARGPDEREMEMARRASHLAAIAIASHEAERLLEQAKAAAELGSRTKSEFLANMSHELRTPLNAIIGFAEVLESELKQQGSPIAKAGYASDIAASGRHLLNLINDILDVSKMEAGKVELRERICDPGELLAGCERIVRARAMERRIDLRLEVPPGLPPVLVDDVKFKQIVLNLLSNAIKFTAPSGSVRVKVQADPARGLTIAVSDTGIGIRAEDLEKVFIPFNQVDNIYARINPGTGLGLALSRGLAELHGGQLSIESVFGEGTTATLRLPPSRLLTADLADVRG